ncbi:MAG: hypothetical protein IKP50_04305 [Bacilli bacterium]|nr:hypothetical protein [Bacilli bacterium]
MKLKSLFCLGILTFLSLTGCKKQTSEHVHSYDKENIEWVWSETSTGGYTAKAIISCTSCDESKEGHSVEVDATMTNAQTKAPTCSTSGTMTYTASISFEGESYSATKEKAVTDSNAHHYIDVVDPSYLKSAATCTEDAIYYKSCEFCHEKSQETFSALNTKLGHHMIHHAATSATCQVEGNIEYYECDRCHKLYLEEAGTTEVTQNDVVIPTAHHYIEVQDNAYLKSPATCTEDITYYKSCEFCHELSSETFTVSNTKLGHQMVHQTATTSTCQEHGHIEHYECERCHKYFADEQGTTELSENDVILPLSHNMTHHAEVPATCIADGTAEYYTCSYEPDVLYKDEAGTQAFADASELVIEKLGHQFNESLNCVRGDTTLKQEFGLVDTEAKDLIAPATISNTGLTSGTVVPSGTSHLWGNYDYVSNGGIDWWIKLSYPTPTEGTDFYSLFYLFSDGGEGGIVFRFGLSRYENDGIVPVYIYSQTDYSANPGTTVVHNAGASGTFFYIPRISGVKSSTNNILHLSAYCLDEATNLFRCTFTAGIEGGTQYYPSTNAEDKTNTVKSFDICLGANYFNNGAGRKVRISCNAANRATVYDTFSEESTLVYKDASGNAVGKLNNVASANLPNLTAANKKFVGWFDPQGNRIANGSAITTKTIVTPRFVDNQSNMFVPSDTVEGEFAAAKGSWYESSSFGTECGGRLPVSEVTDRYDLYYIYHFVAKTDNDNYAIFGFPFDFTDAQTRIHFRIDNKEDGSLTSYIYGGATNLGDVTVDGNKFSVTGFRANNSDLLIHLAVYNASSDGLTLAVEVINLGNGQSYTTSRDVTFNTTGLYSLTNPARNMFDCMKHACEYRITDAF